MASFSGKSEWSKENKLLSRNILKGSNKKFIFECKNCDRSFTTAPISICAGRRCPYCVNKTEKNYYNGLK